jgi:glycosyltransferase involved in cell wall biosynthesis
VQKLIEHLEGISAEHRFSIFLRKENWDAYAPHNERFCKVLADDPWYSLAEQIHFPRVCLRTRCDLIHFPHYNVPLLYRKPFVVTIHDLIVSRYPTVRATTLSPLTYGVKHAVYEMVIRSAIMRARHILTVSKFSQSVITKTYGIPQNRITVTYEAADRLAPPRPHTPPGGERPRYLLYVGNAYPHKNLEGLIQAFGRVKERTREPLQLVLIGKMDYFYARLRSSSRSLPYKDDIIFPGYVTDEQLARWYASAFLYVFPSFEEGFGLPPLEAMSAGVPVASSNQSCLPEVLGGAAEYFDPKRPEQIARAILTLLANGPRRAELIRRGYDQARRYRWDDLARMTLDVYTRACHS